MFRASFSISILVGIAACAQGDRVEVIQQEEAYLAFADVKSQLIDYQSHMDWLALHPEQDPVLKRYQGAPIYCGRPGGIRLDITSAVASLALETSSGGGLNTTMAGTGGAMTRALFGAGGSRTGSMNYSYAVEIGEQIQPRPGGTTPLAATLLTLRNNFMLSQYEVQKIGPSCLNWAPGDGNFATLKLVKANQQNGGAFFALGPLVLNPTVSNGSSLTNALTVKFELSPQLMTDGRPAPRRVAASKPDAGKGSKSGDKPVFVTFGNDSPATLQGVGAIMLPMDVPPLFPAQ
ncbi:hypothetical protein SAMN04489859_106513 [Paracoccus alcaliphilus]|uniref:Uncharacterized protein n=1 Tax=Paracoccus alcaliphilus TaxID=34002 RepID=A0A1H8NN01_9RHOB|nr:hypothetical protein [Paracoccus alcaliphilus]WCR17483.1 hypothetical protein JHW40_14265 [Paracoccus alcaliphilus]SEO30899.1 hypothetical protein SAMN04489859_106513 [Paracoccus alcaliphilus]